MAKNSLKEVEKDVKNLNREVGIKYASLKKLEDLDLEEALLQTLETQPRESSFPDAYSLALQFQQELQQLTLQNHQIFAQITTKNREFFSLRKIPQNKERIETLGQEIRILETERENINLMIERTEGHLLNLMNHYLTPEQIFALSGIKQ